jgi:hypothetical protein
MIATASDPHVPERRHQRHVALRGVDGEHTLLREGDARRVGETLEQHLGLGLGDGGGGGGLGRARNEEGI